MAEAVERRTAARMAPLLAMLLVASACGGSNPAGERASTALPPTAAGYPDGAITLLAPARPGGGWDQTARQIQQVWTGVGIPGVPVEVVNRGGAGGTIGLADFVTRFSGDPHMLLVFGQVMLGATRTNRSPVSIDQTVPLARLLHEYEVVTVPADVVLSNWRGMAAPPGTDDATREWLIRALARMRESAEWQSILRANHWEDSFLAGEAFGDFLRDEAVTVDGTLRAIGLIR